MHELTLQISVTAIFCVTFILLVLEKLEKTIVGLGAGIVLLLLGLVEFDKATLSIDFRAIGLLLGMMLLVEALREVKLFDWLALRLAVYTEASPLKVFLLFGLSTAVLSAFLDNVTTVLVTVPLVLSLTRALSLNPKPYLLSLIFLSNVGGTWTLIGDPPNILIGSKVTELSFFSFIRFLTVPVILSIASTLLYFRWRYQADTAAPGGSFRKLFFSQLMIEHLKGKSSKIHISREIFTKVLGVLGAVFLLLFSQSLTHLEPAVVALGGSLLLIALLKNEVNVHHILQRVEWSTLLFFSGLFMIVGALEHVGILRIIATLISSCTSETWILILVVLFVSAVLSAIIDNIPFVAVMIPVLQQIIGSEPFSQDPKAYLLWWALSLGACFGGNATIIGASANVVSCAIARQQGLNISFKEFLRDSIPVTVATILISAVYLMLLYFFLPA